MAVLFPLGVRLSTWICLGVFAVLAVRRRDAQPLFAAWVWLVGFEMAFDISALVFDGYQMNRVWPIFLGAFTVVWVWRTGSVEVDLRFLAAAGAIWVVWLAFGFPWNAHAAVHVSVFAEILNESAKTLWAVAYLWPLLHRLPEANTFAEAGGAAPADLRF